MSVVWGSIFVSLRIIVDKFCEDVRVHPRKGSGFNYFFLGPNILGYEMVSMNGI